MLGDLPTQGKLVFQQVTQLPYMALLPRNFIQSEVSIHTTCKAGLNADVKTPNITFQLVLQQLHVFVALFTAALQGLVHQRQV